LDARAADWFSRYLQASNSSALKGMFRASRTTQLEYKLDADNQGVPAVYIYYYIIRIALNGRPRTTSPRTQRVLVP
jgi:hypothetical protein